MRSHSGEGLRIGVSASFMHADPERPLFKGKVLKFVEQQLIHWVMHEGPVVYMIPAPDPDMKTHIAAYAHDLDGLVLQGGADLAPETYGQGAMDPKWGGDRVRDLYELELLKAFTAANKPVLGVCRGLQLINVAYGGTLYQDLNTQIPHTRVHRDWQIYDQNFHQIDIQAGSLLAAQHPGQSQAIVSSVHHQGVREVGKGLVIEARSSEDDVVEALRLDGPQWVYGVQWHPEWHNPQKDGVMDNTPLLQAFLSEARKRRTGAAFAPNDNPSAEPHTS